MREKQDIKVLAIIPAFNEEDNIVSTVEDIRKNSPYVDFIVIDDGSTDKTRQIFLENGYPIITLPVNLGLAGGFQTGMRYAMNNGYDYAIQFDADGQHSAEYIDSLIDKAERENVDIVIGSRFQDQKKPKSLRMFGSNLISGIIRMTTGKKIQDPTSGMRLYSKHLIPIFADNFDLSPEPDSLALLLNRGHSIEEVQVEMRDRVAGESYINITKSMKYMMNVCLSILFFQWFRR